MVATTQTVQTTRGATLQDAAPAHSYRIGVVDNDAMTLMALHGLLTSRLELHGITVSWTSRSGREAVDLCVDARTRPALLLVDMGMDDVDGASVCRRIRTFSDRIVLLAMTSYSLNRYRRMAQAAGAQALLDKADFGAMSGVLRDWASGLPHVEPGFTSPAAAHRALCGRGAGMVPGGEGLTDREIEVMDRCIEGYTSREVAQQLGMSESTVKTHIRHAIVKLGARNKLQAVQIWTEVRRHAPR